MKKNLSKETLCVQAGWTPQNGDPRVVPIYQSTTFKYDDSDQMARLFDLKETGYFYTRLQNPTNDAVAAKIAALEGGVGALATSSGMSAALIAILNIAGAGDEVISSAKIYGGTYNLFSKTFKQIGIKVNLINTDDLEAYEKALPSKQKKLFSPASAFKRKIRFT